MDDAAVAAISQAIAANKWHPGCPPEYLPALSRDILYALKQARIAVVEVPVVAHKGPNDTDASVLLTAAAKAESAQYPVGGSNVGRAVGVLLRAVSESIGVTAEEKP